jgi:hypothetical protein
MVSEDKVPGHRPEGSKSTGPTFKTGVPARAGRRVRFPSASAREKSGSSRRGGLIGLTMLSRLGSGAGIINVVDLGAIVPRSYRDEVFEVGDAFYTPPGHVPVKNEPGTEILWFSPSEELRTAEAVMMKNMQAMQDGSTP